MRNSRRTLWLLQCRYLLSLAHLEPGRPAWLHNYNFHIPVSVSSDFGASGRPAWRIFTKLWTFLESTIRLLSTCHWFAISSMSPFWGRGRASEATWRCKKAFYWTGRRRAQTFCQDYTICCGPATKDTGTATKMQIQDEPARLSWNWGPCSNFIASRFWTLLPPFLWISPVTPENHFLVSLFTRADTQNFYPILTSTRSLCTIIEVYCLL